MGIIKSDTQRIMEAVGASQKGHHRKAANIMQSMGNEYRNPNEKKAMWKVAESYRKKADS